MAIAVRIARAATGRDKIAFCGYHGWHDWYLSANLQSENALEGHLLPGLSPAGVPKALKGTALPFHYNKLDELEKIVASHSSDIAAIVMEPIRNDEPKNNFLDHVRNIAYKNRAVLIFDEISAGFRLNSGGAHLLYNVNPDISVFSKAIGNGYPISSIIGKKDVMDAAQKTFISSSNWTERIGPTAAIATIKKHIKMNCGQHLTKIGKRVQKGWRSIAEKNGLAIKVGGIAPLSHFIFNYENALYLKAYFIQLMLAKGILASNVFYAMFSHTDKNINFYLDAVDDTFYQVKKAIDSNSVEKVLNGKPSVSGFKRLI